MKCKHCGYEIPERAVICPECGEIVPREKQDAAEKKTENTTVPDSFSMPFLSATPESAEQSENAAVQDPVEIQRQQREKRTKLRRRITGISILSVLVLVVILYCVLLGGYKLAVFRYVKGVDYASGSMYTALVPDTYIDHLEDTYDFTRREVKEMMGDYFTSWNQNYGNPGKMSYQINSAAEMEGEELAELEQELKSLYDISVEIKKGVTVKLTINDGGQKAAESAVFIKIGQRWYCMEAMEDIDYVCQYDGYGQW